MNNRFFLAIAAVAITLVSCSQNDMEVVNVTTSDAITLSPSTAVTRAGITDYNTISAPNAGFTVFANVPNQTTWYTDHGTPTPARIDGDNKHVFDGSKWNFATPVMWPETGNYPINFYAFYPDFHNGININADLGSSIVLDIEINEKVEDQIDIVSAHGTATTKPATASLSLNFNHILSKVNFAVSNTSNVVGDIAFVQAVGFDHVNSSNDFDVKKQQWNSSHGVRKAFNYYNAFVGLDPTGTDTYTEISFANSVDKAPFYTASTNPKLANANMMLLPQTATTTKMWTVTPKVKSTPANDEAYVRVMYRYELSNDQDYIGFRNAQDHPEWAGSAYAIANPTYNGHLYVKAGFTYEGTWVKGKGYLYNIPLPGDGGGRLLDEYLYDDKGNRTDLKYPGGEEGEPVISTDEYIHLIPIVTDWGTDINENVAD